MGQDPRQRGSVAWPFRRAIGRGPRLQGPDRPGLPSIISTALQMLHQGPIQIGVDIGLHQGETEPIATAAGQ